MVGEHPTQTSLLGGSAAGMARSMCGVSRSAPHRREGRAGMESGASCGVAGVPHAERARSRRASFGRDLLRLALLPAVALERPNAQAAELVRRTPGRGQMQDRGSPNPKNDGPHHETAAPSGLPDSILALVVFATTPAGAALRIETNSLMEGRGWLPRA